MNIEFTLKGKINQYLTSISSYNLEGSIDKAINYLNELKSEYSGNIKVIGHQGYNTNNNLKEINVKFDKIYIKYGNKMYDEGEELQLWGERNPTNEEKIILDAEKAKDEKRRFDYEKSEFERLSKKFKI